MKQILPVEIRLGNLGIVLHRNARRQTVALGPEVVTFIHRVLDFMAQQLVLGFIVALDLASSANFRPLITGHRKFHTPTGCQREIGDAFQFAVLLRVDLKVLKPAFVVEVALAAKCNKRNESKRKKMMMMRNGAKRATWEKQRMDTYMSQTGDGDQLSHLGLAYR